MTRTVSLSIILFLTLTFVQAQEDRSLHFGFHYQPQISRLIADDETLSQKSNLNHSFGVDLFMDLSSRIQLKTGLSYSRSG